ncbi:MAG: hypothetical protein HYR94_23285 [Chloroflexi bacterium]|nr:hypothetical protein [Chloroflexota bacterium]
MALLPGLVVPFVVGVGRAELGRISRFFSAGFIFSRLDQRAAVVPALLIIAVGGHGLGHLWMGLGIVNELLGLVNELFLVLRHARHEISFPFIELILP